MLDVAIIGCGKISDTHAWAIQNIPDTRIIAVCDQEPLMAEQMRERFKVKRCFSDVRELLDNVNPHVVHITTPPQSHFELGIMCLEAGCHVYLEKPFTLDSVEADKLISFANKKKLKIMAGHNDQFTNAARRLRKLIKEGYLGGKPVHMESYYCYDLSDEVYAKALLGDKEHWVRKLPGKLLHNIISHGIARIAEFLETTEPKVFAHGYTSPTLKRIGETEIIDELRVIIEDGETSSAYFTFSSQMRPSLHQFRIYGPKNGLLLDHDNQTVIKIPGRRFKSYLDKFIPNLLFSREYYGNSWINLKDFLKRDFHVDGGMRFLIESFYKAIRGEAPMPITHREILLTAKIMDDIFNQLNQ